MCTVDDQCTLDLKRLVDVFDTASNTWTTSKSQIPIQLSNNYPFMFVLPDGKVFYAGVEGVENVDTNGYLFDPSTLQWTAASTFEAVSATGNVSGAAVMYEPGKIMRAGGFRTPVRSTEWIDLSGDYDDSTDWQLGGKMCDRRHFHSMVILPDGTVLAAGGNRFDNSAAGDNTTNDCAPAQIVCPRIECGTGGMCVGDGTSCSSDEDCAFDISVCPPVPGDVQGCLQGGGPNGETVCNPGNNACFAVNTIEIWDPRNKSWRKAKDPQTGDDIELQEERVYHHTSLLMPDGRVVVMGGGFRSGLVNQHNREIVTPPYLLTSGARPSFTLPGSLPENRSFFYGACGESVLELQMDPGSPAPDRVTLVRLGSVTHQNDMDQRFIELCSEGLSNCTYNADDGTLFVNAPCAAAEDGPQIPNAIAPPGYYMMFVLSATGVPSVGQYIKIGPATGMRRWHCAPSPGFAAVEESCTVDPTGACAPADTVSTTLATPTTADGAGWTILSGPNEVADPSSPTSAEQTMLDARCTNACELEWANNPAVSTNCASALLPAYSTGLDEGSTPLDFVSSQDVRGEGLICEDPATCNLAGDCCTRFDENVCRSRTDRPTPLHEVGSEGAAEYEVTTSVDGRNGLAYETPYSDLNTVDLTATASYSFCTSGSERPCPFYLRTLDISVTEPVIIGFSGVTKTLTNVALRIVQPAFGITDDSPAIGFPRGSIVADVEFDMDGHHYRVRGPNPEAFVMAASAGALQVVDLPLSVSVPVGGQDVRVDLEIDLFAEIANERPPVVANQVPNQVSCGAPFSLSASVSDPDGDLTTTRWWVGDDLLVAGVTTLSFASGSRTLTVEGIDARGAATREAKEVTCQ